MARSPTFLLMLALVVAGCAGSKPTDADPDASDEPTGLPQGVFNILQGTVVGPDQAPIENATVEVISLAAAVATDEAGAYYFENLEPRDYLVAVTKEGYRTKTQRAIIQDGQIFDLDFELEEKPLDRPYNTTTPFDAFISCQVVYATNPENVQYHDCGTGVDSNNKVAKEFHLDPNGAQVVVEAFWQPKTALANRLTLEVESVGFGHQDLIFGKTSGPSGLKLPISENLMRKYYAPGGTLKVTVGGAPSVDDSSPLDPGLALQQDVDIFVTVFYIEPGPPNFTYRPT